MHNYKIVRAGIIECLWSDVYSIKYCVVCVMCTALGTVLFV